MGCGIWGDKGPRLLIAKEQIVYSLANSHLTVPHPWFPYSFAPTTAQQVRAVVGSGLPGGLTCRLDNLDHRLSFFGIE
jgi:hypothetical protein